MHPDYIQHDPNAPTGRDATMALLGSAMRNNPDLTHEVKRVIHGDDRRRGLVAVHHHFRRTQGRTRPGGGRHPADQGRLRRRALGRDAAGPRSGETKNANGMF